MWCESQVRSSSLSESGIFTNGWKDQDTPTSAVGTPRTTQSVGGRTPLGIFPVTLKCKHYLPSREALAWLHHLAQPQHTWHEVGSSKGNRALCCRARMHPRRGTHVTNKKKAPVKDEDDMPICIHTHLVSNHLQPYVEMHAGGHGIFPQFLRSCVGRFWKEVQGGKISPGVKAVVLSPLIWSFPLPQPTPVGVPCTLAA